MEAGVDVAEDVWGVVGGSSWGVIYVEVESVEVQADIGGCERVGLKGEGSRGKSEESVGAGRGGVWGPAGKIGRGGGGGVVMGSGYGPGGKEGDAGRARAGGDYSPSVFICE